MRIKSNTLTNETEWSLFNIGSALKENNVEYTEIWYISVLRKIEHYGDKPDDRMSGIEIWDGPMFDVYRPLPVSGGLSIDLCNSDGRRHQWITFMLA